MDTGCVELTIPSRLQYLPLVSACVAVFCRWTPELSGDEKAVYNVQLAVQEAATNVIEHAYEGRADGQVKFVLRSLDAELEVEITDHGKGFDFDSVPAPSLSEMQERGYGIFLMKRLVDAVSYHSDPDAGNRWCLRKRFDRPQAQTPPTTSTR